MLNKLKKSNAKGFTIIEVMIVLAIAGLILLIVFLAVPALQRSSRNTQRKNDASAVAGALANFISNNGGSLPALLGNDASTTTIDLCGTGNGGAAKGGTTICTAGTNLETAKMGYYTQSQVYIGSNAAVTITAVGSGESAAKVSTNTMAIDLGYTCNSGNTAVGTANQRSAAVLYVTEAGSGNGSLQCVEQ